MRVLITGGSGYLGQFIIETLQKDHTVAYTYLANSIAGLQLPVQGFKVDLATGEGVQGAVLEFQPQVVINCAAISQPAACERDYEACTAVNVPKHLVEALHQLQHQHGLTALLIHISTDQVREGFSTYANRIHSTANLPCLRAKDLKTAVLLLAMTLIVWSSRATLLRLHLFKQLVAQSLAYRTVRMQVYDGSKSFWCESDPTQPVNAYGRSKLEAEQYLQQFWTGRCGHISAQAHCSIKASSIHSTIF